MIPLFHGFGVNLEWTVWRNGCSVRYEGLVFFFLAVETKWKDFVMWFDIRGSRSSVQTKAQSL